MRIVIIGNGVAGMEAALVVREREPDARITLVSEESDHFFSRTALMWIASGQLSHRDTEPLERDVYVRLGFERVRARATGVRVREHEVVLAGGLAPLPYDRLLIACGARARPAPWPGTELRGVGHFVTHQDLDWLMRELYGPGEQPAPPRARAHLAASAEGSPYAFRPTLSELRGRAAAAPVVIGGGLIGMEVVEVCLAAGARPRFLLRDEWFWPMAIEPREAAWITERVHEHGVDVRHEHEVQALLGDAEGNLRAVRTQDGELAADMAVVAIGIVPNTDWLEGSNIERLEDGSILVDETLASSAPDVFAAGDCAGVRWFDGTRKPQPLWYTARDQGRVAGRGLVGIPARYQRGIWYNSAKLMDIEYTTCGLVNVGVRGERNWFYEERGKVRSTTRIVSDGERVVGFNLLGRRWDQSVLARFIHERRSLDWVLDHLHEAAFDTELVPPLRIPAEARAQGAGEPPSRDGTGLEVPEHW